MATIYEYDGLTFDLLDVRFRIGENPDDVKKTPLRAFFPTSAPTKSLTSPAGTFYRVSLGLNVNHIEAEYIFLYQAIDAAITRPTNSLGRVAKRAAIAHFGKQLNNEPLEKLGCRCLDLCEELLFSLLSKLRVSVREALQRRSCGSQSGRFS